MPHKLFLLCLIFTVFSGLESRTSNSSSAPYFFSSEKVLDAFFKDLFENTTAGYVLYGQKPVDLEGFKAREKTIPGTKERRASVTSLLALKYWKEIAPPLKKNQNYFLIDFCIPDGHEITLINRKAFLDIVKANSLLFEYKFGMDITPENILENLIQNGFSSLFKEKIALQGIVLGYGTENSICYECGTSFLKLLAPKIVPPKQLTSTQKKTEELVKKIKDRNWVKKIQDLTHYKSSEQNDRVKIPFSFIKNSNESKKLLKSYKKYQESINYILNKKNFTHEILQRLSAQIPPPAKIICSNQLMDFFTEEERNRLPHLIAQTILNTFADEISPSFFQGMGAAETEIQETLEYSDIKFLDIFWNRNKAALQQTTCFFEQISNQKNVHCLIPNKLYFCILKESTSINALSKNNRAIKAKYLLKDCEENVLVGSYELQEPPILNLDEMIPGLSYGLLGMKEGEIREIFIHPDFAYGASDFGNGQVVQAVVELIHLDTPTEESVFPFLKPAEVSNYAPDISSCSEFIELQKKHAYACGLRSWIYYKKAAPLITLDSVLDEIPKMEKTALSDLDENLLLRLEWLLLQDSGS